MRVLVTGDRHWSDFDLIKWTLARLGHIEVLCHGAARGADTLAGKAAKVLGIKVVEYPAQWDKHGKAAGPIRNQRMLTEFQPDLVLAFHDNLEQSKGTKDMIARAQRARIQVKHYRHSIEVLDAAE